MRSGTSTLTRWLDQHPQVYMAPGKELHFFDEQFERGLGWYGSHFSAADRATSLGEATSDYVHDLVALQRISATLPTVRLILSLRNPVDRAYSHYWHNRTRGKESLSFESALEAESLRVNLSYEDRARYSYLSRGDYMVQINQVLKLFPREQLHVEIAEEMHAEPLEALGRIFDFIGTDARYRPGNLSRRVNAYTEFRSLRARQIAKRLPRLLARPLNRANAITNLNYPPMDQQTKVRLFQRYDQGARDLTEFLGRTSPIWDFDSYAIGESGR